ncbi:hypothetical protein CK226_15750 [Mesorhizobium sp. WSM4311]|nr:hypothetical protein CK226_15750 [Mesorhizobium sp. WSM4311]
MARLIAAPFLFLVVLLVAAWTSGSQEIICKQTKGGEEHCAPYNLAAYYLVEIKETIDENDGLITTLATIVIAAFTCTLWLSTRNLWLAGERQMTLIESNATQQSADMQASTKAAQDAVAVARETGVAQIRAYISVTKVEVGFHSLPYLIDVTTGKSTKQYQMWVDLKVGNFGRTPARRIQTSWVISRYSDQSDIWAGRHNYIENIDIPPEQTDYIVSDAQFKAPAEAGERFAKKEIDLVLEGAVIYDPVAGPPQRITPFLYLLSFDETLDSGVKIRMSTYVDHAT